MRGNTVLLLLSLRKCLSDPLPGANLLLNFDLFIYCCISAEQKAVFAIKTVFIIYNIETVSRMHVAEESIS